MTPGLPPPAPHPDYFARLAAAYVRGRLADQPPGDADPDAVLFATPLDCLAPADLERLIQLGLARGLRLHRFKRTMGLARVRKVLGILHGLQPETLLDIGSGRGAFLWPLLDAFPALPVTAVDLLERRVADLLAVRAGGESRLRALRADATSLPLAEATCDVVTALEVLEHIPDTQRALAEVCRVARRFVVLSVPARADDNPEHIHLFDARTLRAVFMRLEKGCGIRRG